MKSIPSRHALPLPRLMAAVSLSMQLHLTSRFLSRSFALELCSASRYNLECFRQFQLLLERVAKQDSLRKIEVSRPVVMSQQCTHVAKDFGKAPNSSSIPLSSSGLSSYFNSSVHADAVVKCRTKKFNVHKIILCSGSKFFRSCLEGPFRVCFFSTMDFHLLMFCVIGGTNKGDQSERRSATRR